MLDNTGLSDLYAAEALHHRLLSHAEEIALSRKALSGDIAARDELLACNQKLVVKMALRFYKPGYLIELMDLVNFGNEGLIVATQKYDPDKGFRFSTYATWWIRHHIMRNLEDTAKTIRLPSHMIQRIQKLRKIEAELEQICGPNGYTDEQVIAVSGWSLYELQNARRAIIPLSSLNEPAGPGYRDEIGDLIPAEGQPVSAAAEQSDLKECLEEELASLTPREAKILRLRYGLDNGGVEMTLKEIGAKFGLTRERIRQIERDGLRKLRHPSHARKLKEYVS